ncbi:hypothetical protein [Allomesorhizobium camelthorni]|uniref:Uncharacterized protein n=1 Tax=Allomesorhizobium camelthorni TaxID=475069 RepID=A0A6G4W6W2_9HYPH|nr:hypothetical protein [Mesorhizobium camelthorni]NGO49907.1 hypothetical protein [Mesorhizobium camelthorni]
MAQLTEIIEGAAEPAGNRIAGRGWLGFCAAAFLLAGAPPAMAGDRWEEAGSGAVAILPVPLKATAITGGSFSCAEQRWSFRLRVEATSAAPRQVTDAVVAIDGVDLPAKASLSSGVATIAIPFETLELLKAGNRLSFAFNGEPATMFSLRGSRAVLDAVAPRCSEVDMSAYQSVALSETDQAIGTAAKLMAEEAALFRKATGKQPVLAAASVKVAPDAEMVFASLCGSSRYYGESGCTLSGFARQGASGDWREVYNSEGMALYLDPKTSADGWPDLVTLAQGGGAEPSHWMWNGLAYEIRESAIAKDAELRGAVQ